MADSIEAWPLGLWKRLMEYQSTADFADGNGFEDQKTSDATMKEGCIEG